MAKDREVGRLMDKWLGITYPSIFGNAFVWAIWARLFCRRGWHLWDEVLSIESHSLFCDACELDLEVAEEV